MRQPTGDGDEARPIGVAGGQIPRDGNEALPYVHGDNA